MKTTDHAIEILKSRLLEIEINSKNKKEEIERQYKEAISKASTMRSQSIFELETEDIERINIINALKALGAKSALKEMDIPPKFSSELNFIKKTIYALSLIKTGDVEDVKAKLLELEPNINQKSLQDLNQRLSGLYNKGYITAIRNGRRYIYSIK